jgi:hypothetical protein
MTAFAGWENFYVIVGSSAGALIGLQFVVITLIADMPAVRGQHLAGAAFGTPTIVHLGAVLLLAAMLTVPWHTVGAAAALWGILGICGVVYEIIVTRRMRVQTLYKPEFEDWLCHSLLPFAAYATLAGSAYAARSNVGGALFGVGVSALLLLFISIHNAWDAVTYHVYVQRQGRREEEKQR